MSPASYPKEDVEPSALACLALASACGASLRRPRPGGLVSGSSQPTAGTIQKWALPELEAGSKSMPQEGAHQRALLVQRPHLNQPVKASGHGKRFLTQNDRLLLLRQHRLLVVQLDYLVPELLDAPVHVIAVGGRDVVQQVVDGRLDVGFALASGGKLWRS